MSGGYPVAERSPYEAAVRTTTGGITDSRTMQVNPGADLPAKVIGGGCTLVVAVKKL